MSKLDQTLPKNASDKFGDHPSISSVEGISIFSFSGP
jgi:hypothetical protein